MFLVEWSHHPSPPPLPLNMLTIELRTANLFWAHNPISFWNMSLWCALKMSNEFMLAYLRCKLLAWTHGSLHPCMWINIPDEPYPTYPGDKMPLGVKPWRLFQGKTTKQTLLTRIPMQPYNHANAYPPYAFMRMPMLMTLHHAPWSAQTFILFYILVVYPTLSYCLAMSHLISMPTTSP